MQRFYKDFESIDRFSLSLDYHHHELECLHCSKSDQFVSHGRVYKQRSMSEAEKVGKRLLCSNRYGRTGCGRTFQLYVATEIPRFRYGTAQLFVFISALLAHKTITESYLQATRQPSIEPRNAWRWMNRLMAKLSEYRTHLKARHRQHAMAFPHHRARCQHLLPTLAQLIRNTPHGLCSDYQYLRQRAFI